MAHRNARLTPVTRRELVREVEAGWPQAEVARRFRVSRPTVGKWVRRYQEAGTSGLEDRGSAPRRRPPPRADTAPMYPSLAGKRAVVLGGSRGIGRAIALRLAAEGTHVLVNYARSTEAAAATAEQCRALGVEAEAVQADVGDAPALSALSLDRGGGGDRRAVPRAGRRGGGGAGRRRRRAGAVGAVRARRVPASGMGGGLDILVNNAARGLERPRPAIEQRPKHLRATMDVNLFGPWQASQAAVPMMEAQGGGAIVNLMSPGAFHYMPDYSAVAASKGALASLTLYLAVELAPRGIRVNAVSAGWVEGSEGEHSYRDEVSDRVRPHVPAGRNVSPEDVAAAVAWVCSDEAPMLVGQTIHVDGGFEASAWNAVLKPGDG